jgi:transposase-like protein
VQEIKLLSLASFKVGAKSILKLSLIVKNVQLKGIIRGKVKPVSILHSDYWRGYNGLVDIGYKKHYRIHPGDNEFSACQSHINGIKSFWFFAKRRLIKFQGIPQLSFYLLLKECEFRFNYREQNLYAILLKMIRSLSSFIV